MSVTPEPRDLTAAAISVLREAGPLTSEDLAERLASAGHGTAPEMTEFVELLDHPLVVLLADGRNAVLDTLLGGRVFTHRLTGSELGSGLLDAEPDLAPLVLLAMADDEGPVRVLFSDYDADEIAALGISDEDFPDGSGLLFGTAALQGCSAGDVVAVAVRGDGSLELSRVDGELAAAPDLSGGLDRIIGPDNADNLETVVWQLLVDDDTLCAVPTAPLGELIEAAGYDREGDYIAARGFDFEAHRLATHIAMVAREHELHPDEADAVVTFVQCVGVVHDDELDAPAVLEYVGSLGDSLVGLEDPAAAAAALDLINGVEDDFIPALYATASAVADRGPRRARASGHWLAGMAADTLGDVLEAERQFADAAALDEAWTPALFELAQIASDRGDAQRGLSLLGRIDGGAGERLYDVLTRFAPTEHPELGRNDRCWCGSGRKYKVCHLGKSDSTLDDRAHWLYEKAGLYAQSTVLFDLVLELAQRRAGQEGDEHAIAQAFEEPLVLDVALFEGGLFELFVGRRGVLLPADELELAGRWLQVRRSVHEVTASDESVVTLRDLRTGDTAVVDGEWAVGDLLCARVVPTGERTQILGGAEPVPADRRGAVLEVLSGERVTPEDVIDVLG
ncbi:SEC-C domain-containing protein [Prescottella defluvii]|uniref:SEC-C domain-containing protein n=1 Tax=Prescottella defluvii TaxID=1323361 RepID=UPI0004F2D804|nr:SEC-C domain-containing protein [Prescottella defluvii]